MEQALARVPHCIVRAKERYGLDITIEELKALTRRCHDGEGHQKNAAVRTGRGHTILYNNRVLDCVWLPPRGDHNIYGTIVTIYPPGTLAKQVTFNDVRHMKKRYRR